MNAKIIAVFTLSVGQVAADTCYALAFSSGTEASAYQAGVLKGLVAAHGADDYAYSVISGMGGGAVNAAILGSYPVGQEDQAADRMIQFWVNASNTDLYHDWLGGLGEGFALKGGLYNNKPL
jgi:predicted acylesterase/phospholipase RssA